MNDDLHRIRSYVSALVRRERLLLATRVLLQLGLLWSAAAVFVVVAPSAGLARPSAFALLVILAGAGAWLAAVWPLVRSWRPTGDLLRQARRVELLAPALRGRLVTTVERLDGPRPAESAALVGLAAKRAQTVLLGVPRSRVHSALPLVPLSVANALVLPVILLALLLSPLGPSGLFAWWRGDLVAVSLVDEALPEGGGAEARVGDIVLRYVYPSYTGRDPVEVPNSTGDVQGPPGTRVYLSLRSARPVTSGALLAYNDPGLEVGISDDGRAIEGNFVIGAEAGAWRVRTVVGTEALETRAFSITPVADLAPEVNIDAPASLEHGVDQQLSIPWTVSDDYGISRVMVALDGTPISPALFEPGERRPAAEGRLTATPGALGLTAGAVVDLTIVAWDNDAVSGMKQGVSRTVKLRVLGESGLDASVDARMMKLRDVLLFALADFLEEDWPPGETGGDVARWGEVVASRFEDFDELAASYERAWRVEASETRAIRGVQQRASTLIRYTQVAFTPGSTERPNELAWNEVGGLRESTVLALEDAILALDNILQARASAAVLEAIDRLEKQSERLAQLLAQDEVPPQAMLAELEVLERRLAALQEKLSKLQKEGLREMLNQRTDSLSSLSEEIRKALAEGREDEAKKLMKRMQEEIDRLAQHMREQAERAQSEANETMENAKSLLDELKKLEKDQRALQEQTAEVREKQEAESGQKAQVLWEELDAAVDALKTKGSDYHAGLTKASRAFYEQERASQAVEDTLRLEESVDARDLRGSQREALDVRRSWARVQATLKREQNLQRTVSGPANRELRGIGKDLDNIERLLSKLDQLDESSSPETRKQARQLEKEQEALQKRMQQAKKDAEALSQEFPVRPEGLGEALEEAEKQAGQAGAELGEGKPMPAEGAQEVAAQRLKEAQQALQQAMQQAAEQQAAGQGGKGQPGGPGEGEAGEPGEDGKPEGEGGDSDGRFAEGAFKMPDPEDDFSAEEYRRSLLEGMEGDVPEEFRGLKKRYYEELVRQ